MSTNFLSTLSNFFLLVSALALLLSGNWRWRLGALALQYLGVFALVISSWPLELAAVKLVTGWVACAMLAFTLVGMEANAALEREPGTNLAFRGLAAALVILVVSAVAPGLTAWAAPISSGQAWGAMLLIAMGLLNLSLSSLVLTTMLGLLTVFQGFEILYAAVETSTLVAGLLAMLNLGIALVGAYLIVLPTLEARE